MDSAVKAVLKERLGNNQYAKLAKIDNPGIGAFIAKYVEFCNPSTVFVCTDSEEDIQYIRNRAIESGEESPLAMGGHTIHFDAYGDQGRDKDHTNILVPKGMDLGASISTRDRDEGLGEIHEILKDMMHGRELYICFFLPGTDQFSLLDPGGSACRFQLRCPQRASAVPARL